MCGIVSIECPAEGKLSLGPLRTERRTGMRRSESKLDRGFGGWRDNWLEKEEVLLFLFEREGKL